MLVIVLAIGGAIKASVEELIEPTSDMKRSSLGIAAASPTEKNEYGFCRSEEINIDVLEDGMETICVYRNICLCILLCVNERICMSPSDFESEPFGFKQNHAVDGITGATITSKGLSDFLLRDLLRYERFLRK